uniref:Uncharacterized protein n=1 Tax=Ditylenchus dipsaci TaxID=166011 RepID=A0A915EHI8_9BILA
MDGPNPLARMTPIQPANEDGVKIEKEEIVRSSMSPSGQSPINAYLINRIANLVSPPNTPTDPQSPLARENLDFVFQNALNA